jgi:hypothetical protein
MWLVVSSLGFKMFATAKAQRSPQTWVLFDPKVTKHDFAAKICMSRNEMLILPSKIVTSLNPEPQIT